jgi:hypothetical protein
MLKKGSTKKTYQRSGSRVEARRKQLVEEALAADGTTETRNTIRSVNFTLKLVVVREFLI